MSNSKLVIAKSLAGAAFILALVDAVWSRQLSASRCRHRGIIFGLSTIAFSTTVFFISLRQRSLLVSALLISSGIVITIHGVIETRNLVVIYFPGPILGVMFGLCVLALGIAKSIKAGMLIMSTPAK
jgi:hypothetical protein